MQYQRSTDRRGVTLIEVLVAIFVMGIGLLALLVLFPVGVLTMAQAIQDERCAQACNQATAIAQVLDLRNNGTISPSFQNPNAATYVNAGNDEPSHPLYIDSVGTLSFLPPYSTFVGGIPNGVVRLQAPFAGNKLNTLKWCTLLDDLVFDDKGLPAFSGGRVERDTRYSWAYLLRRPRQCDTTVVDVQVVVYNQRPMSLNNNLQGSEPAYTAFFDLPRNVIVLTWPAAGAPPPVTLGAWLMDVTAIPANAPPPPTKFKPGHAAFYRVVGITELGLQGNMPLNGLVNQTQVNANVMEVEVQSPLQDFPVPAVPPVNCPSATLPAGGGAQEPHWQRYQGTVVLMQGVAEVFDMRHGWR